MEALGLPVGTVRSFDVRSFVPVEAKPAQVFEDAHLGLVRGPLGVSVFDAKDEGAVLAVGEQPVEQRRPGIADVQLAGRTGSKTESHFFICAGAPPPART